MPWFRLTLGLIENWLWVVTATVRYVWLIVTIKHSVVGVQKSVDSTKALNKFRYLDMSSCLLAGQFCYWLMCCFRASGCVLVFVQWNKR